MNHQIIHSVKGWTSPKCSREPDHQQWSVFPTCWRRSSTVKRRASPASQECSRWLSTIPNPWYRLNCLNIKGVVFFSYCDHWKSLTSKHLLTQFLFNVNTFVCIFLGDMHCSLMFGTNKFLFSVLCIKKALPKSQWVLVLMFPNLNIMEAIIEKRARS